MAEGALARDAFGALERGEFELYYQPIVDCDGVIRAAEALLRWNHPRLGVLLPGAFLAVIMESGAIRSVGRWVVRSATDQAGRWAEIGSLIDVHLNLSTVELSSGAIEALAERIAEVELDPARICVEVTEHSFVGLGLSSNSIRRLGDLGVRVALDDFGTGAATLSRLRQRPLHIIKLDPGFVQSIDAAPDEAKTDRAILEGIISLAKALGLQWLPKVSRRYSSSTGCAMRVAISSKGGRSDTPCAPTTSIRTRR